MIKVRSNHLLKEKMNMLRIVCDDKKANEIMWMSVTNKIPYPVSLTKSGNFNVIYFVKSNDLVSTISRKFPNDFQKVNH